MAQTASGSLLVSAPTHAALQMSPTGIVGLVAPQYDSLPVIFAVVTVKNHVGENQAVLEFDVLPIIGAVCDGKLALWVDLQRVWCFGGGQKQRHQASRQTTPQPTELLNKQNHQPKQHEPAHPTQTP